MNTNTYEFYVEIDSPLGTTEVALEAAYSFSPAEAGTWEDPPVLADVEVEEIFAVNTMDALANALANHYNSGGGDMKLLEECILIDNHGG